MRSDARRNADAILEAAKSVFASSGVDAPAKQITDLAGVGVGTLYRRFPLRSDLVIAILEREVDECIAAAGALSASHGPSEAVALWVRRYTELVATKRGLAAALHSGDPAFDGLPEYLLGRLDPVLAGLLAAAADAGEIRDDVVADDILRAIAHLSVPEGEEGHAFSQRMVELLLDGARVSTR